MQINSSILKRDDLFNTYTNSIRHYKQLSYEEFLIEFDKYKNNNDEKAFETLIKANLRFVITIANHYQNSYVSLNDLIAAGNIGLIRAIRKFDPSLGFKFSSYAIWHIRSEIVATLKQFTESHKVGKSEFNSIRGSEQIFYDSDDTVENNIESHHESMNADYFFKYESIRYMIKTLTEEEQKVINTYFGLNNNVEVESLKETAKILGFKYARTEMLFRKAIYKLKYVKSYGYRTKSAIRNY